MYYAAFVLIANYIAVTSFNTYIVNTGGIPTGSGYYHYLHPDGIYYQSSAIQALIALLEFRYFIGDPTLVVFSITTLVIPQIGFVLRKPFELIYEKSSRFLSSRLIEKRNKRTAD